MNDMDWFLYQLREDGVDVIATANDLKIIGKSFRLIPSLIAYIKENKQSIINYLQAAVAHYYPIASLQKRMCVSYYSSGKQFAHNLYSSVLLQDHVNCDQLKKSFQQLINEHEILRTGYQPVNDKMIQI